MIETIPLIYVILLTWNDQAAALRCLQSVQAVNYAKLSVLIVDNASKDDTVTVIRQQFPGYQIIVNDANLGFAAGCNVGLKIALANKADFVMLLNQDTLVDECIFQNLVEAVQSHPRAGILAPKTYFFAKTLAGQERLFYGGAWYGRLPLQQRIPGIEAVDDGSNDMACQVDYAWGHGMFLRTDMLGDIGLFDEAYFMYFEDLDLCRRATKAGYEIWYIPQARMWHDTPDGARVTNPEPWRFRYKLRSMQTFYKKNYGLWLGHLFTWLNVVDETRQYWQRGEHTGARILLQTWLQMILQ